METKIISYTDLIIKERQNLQKGMNFRSETAGRLSVFLMSVRKGAPYKDLWFPEKKLLIYEGHDVNTGQGKKLVDQPMYRETGRLSDNGKFFNEAIAFKEGKRDTPLQIQVYEKLDRGIWFDKGIFSLVNSLYEKEGNRMVFKFFLTPSENQPYKKDIEDYKHERMIPTAVKVEVWKRDKGLCRLCGLNTGLHYDHIIPFSKGGRSDDSRNIQLLCARHNLEKSDKIQ